jgi:hypothetical protein
MTRPLPFVYDDGGRAAAGYKGETGDCVTRAIAIATGLDYQTVYDLVNEAGKAERPRKRQKNRSSARTGVYKPTTRSLLDWLGWTWVPQMGIGTGCQVHLAVGELPVHTGTLIVKLSRHIAAVVDGKVHDINDPGRGGTRCVYGFWHKEA